jgi:hypothetical protein
LKSYFSILKQENNPIYDSIDKVYLKFNQINKILNDLQISKELLERTNNLKYTTTKNNLFSSDSRDNFRVCMSRSESANNLSQKRYQACVSIPSQLTNSFTKDSHVNPFRNELSNDSITKYKVRFKVFS